jgi:hypothetical protein
MKQQAYHITFTQKPGFLHATVIGRNTRETVERFHQEALSYCITHHYYRVLLEERLEGPPLETMEIFAIVSRGCALAAGKIKAVAYVDAGANSRMLKFAENVAVNRGIRVRVFPTVAAAEAWLAKLVSADNQRNPPVQTQAPKKSTPADRAI